MLWYKKTPMHYECCKKQVPEIAGLLMSLYHARLIQQESGMNGLGSIWRERSRSPSNTDISRGFYLHRNQHSKSEYVSVSELTSSIPLLFSFQANHPEPIWVPLQHRLVSFHAEAKIEVYTVGAYAPYILSLAFLVFCLFLKSFQIRCIQEDAS